jgi:hypothetical protein
LLAFVITFLAFAACAHLGPGVNNDTAAANLPAWWFVRHGSFFLDHVPALPHSMWFIHAGAHIVSNRTPGIVLFGVPVQGALAFTKLSPDQIGALTAALATAAASANTILLLRRLGSVRLAVGCGVPLIFGTAIWTVAGTELWPHTADVFWISLALLSLTKNRTLLAGILLSPLVLIRPHLSVAIAIIGIWLGVNRRSGRVVAHFAVPAVISSLLLVLWNHYLYGQASIAGGYSGHVDTLPGHMWMPLRYIANIAAAAGSPLRGVFLYTPVAVLALLCIPSGWRRSPDWAKASFVGGLAYEAVQLRLNRYSGGTGFYSNRLVIELLLFAAPLVFLGYQDWRARGATRVRLARALAISSVGIHSLGAVLPGAYLLHQQHWTSWGPIAAVKYEPTVAVSIICLTLILAVALLLAPIQMIDLRKRRRWINHQSPAPEHA